jgi:hypothetical protein
VGLLLNRPCVAVREQAKVLEEHGGIIERTTTRFTSTHGFSAKGQASSMVEQTFLSASNGE